MPASGAPSALDFLTALFHDASGPYIEFRLIREGDVKSYFIEIGDCLEKWERIHPKLLSANEEDRNVYFGVNPRIEKTGDLDHVKECVAIWADLDFKGELSTRYGALLKQIGLDPSIVVDSGRGYHLYWLLREPCDPDVARAIVQELVRTIAADKKTHDPSRILRLPGTLNVKDPKHRIPCRLLRLDASLRYNPDDFDRLKDLPEAERPKGEAKAAAVKPSTVARSVARERNGDGLAHGMARALSPYWQQSKRHHLALATAALLRRCEIPEDQAAEIVLAIATAANDPESGDREKAVATTYRVPEEKLKSSGLVYEILGKPIGDKFLETFNKVLSAVPPPPIERAAFPDLSIYDCIPPGGFFDAYLGYATKFTDAPAQFHIASALTVAAAKLGNSIHVPYYGNRPLFPTLYTLLIGPPGRVRKSTAIGQARDLGNRVELQEYPSDATVEQLYARFAPNVCETADRGDGKEVPVAWEGSPAGLICHSEFSRYLASSSKSYMVDSKSFFTDLYDGGRITRETKSRGKYHLENPAVSLLCGVTPLSLKNALTYRDLGDGFLSRFLVVLRPPVHQANYDLSVDGDLSDIDRYDYVLSALRQIDTHGGAVPYHRGSTADRMRQEFERWVDEKGNAFETQGKYLLDALICRLKAMMTKVALLYTCDAPPGPKEITPEAVGRATAFCRYIAGTMEHFFEMVQPDEGNREIRYRDQALDAIRRWVETHRGPIRHRDLVRWSRLDKMQLERAIETLKDEGRIHLSYVYNGRGRTYALNEREVKS